TLSALTAVNSREVDAEITGDFANRRGGGRCCAAFGLVPVFLRLWGGFRFRACRRRWTASLCLALYRCWRTRLLRRCRLGDGGVFVGGDRDKELADGDLHSFFDVNLANGACLRGWHGAHGRPGVH